MPHKKPSKIEARTKSPPAIIQKNSLRLDNALNFAIHPLCRHHSLNGTTPLALSVDESHSIRSHDTDAFDGQVGEVSDEGIDFLGQAGQSEARVNATLGFDTAVSLHDVKTVFWVDSLVACSAND
jgi:hypothetical protein